MLYRDDPTIMSWQLANEPRALWKGNAYREWIKQTAALIRGRDCTHLISLGSEGATPWPEYVRNDYALDHALVDYVTVHVWPQNWKWYNASQDLEASWAHVEAYLGAAIEAAAAIRKPLVVEEFGLARDGMSHAAAAPTSKRDAFFRRMCAAVGRAPPHVAAGLAFWAWAGEGRPSAPKAVWRVGDAWTGDPPHELQGWYSVYDEDAGTLAAIAECVRLVATPAS